MCVYYICIYIEREIRERERRERERARERERESIGGMTSRRDSTAEI